MNFLQAPKPTGKPLETVELTGMLFPWENGQPVFLGMPGSDYLYLPCFSTEEALRLVLGSASVSFEKIKMIEDGKEFIESFPRRVGMKETKIICNLRLTPAGKFRFLEIKTS